MTEPKSYIEDGIEYVECDSARQFLDYLQIRHERWLPDSEPSSSWIFRGHRRAEWKLEPSAMRSERLNLLRQANLPIYQTAINEFIRNCDGELRSSFGNYRIDRITEAMCQLMTEIRLIRQFVNLADEVGHTIPEDDWWRLKRVGIDGFDILTNEIEIIQYVRDWSLNFFPEYIAFSLAQHHGIPTRLLDWTTSSFTAAFFAAEEVILKADEELREAGDRYGYDFAVWAIDLSLIRTGPLTKVTHKKAKISYLNAQRGLFIYDNSANSYYIQNGIWRTFEKIVSEEYPSDNSPILRKITLPASQAMELVRLLAVENVTRAHLMPTYDNITETLKMQRLINKSLEQS